MQESLYYVPVEFCFEIIKIFCSFCIVKYPVLFNYLCTLFSPIARSCYSSSQDILYSAYVTTSDGRRGYIGRPVTCVNGQEATYCNNTISECILNISGDSYCVCVCVCISH